jgi:hypothetical protein
MQYDTKRGFIVLGAQGMDATHFFIRSDSVSQLRQGQYSATLDSFMSGFVPNDTDDRKEYHRNPMDFDTITKNQKEKTVCSVTKSIMKLWETILRSWR